MVNLIIYGSLLNADEVAGEDANFVERRLVRVRKHQRLFNMVSTRKINEREAAVLNVRPAEGHHFNALMLHGVDAPSLARFDAREYGYDRLEVAPGLVEVQGEPLGKSLPIYMYYGRPERIAASGIVPIPFYLDICTGGAAQWGQDFLAEFKKTTFVDNHVELIDYMDGL